MANVNDPPKATSLLSWPPNSTLTTAQILFRLTLLLNDIIGAPLSICAGVRIHHNSFIVAGSFMVLAALLNSLLLVWKTTLLGCRRPMARKSAHEQLQRSDDGNAKTVRVWGTAMLRLALLVDVLGFTAFLILFPLTVVGLNHYGNRWSRPWNIVMASHASVTTLFPWIFHAMLAMTEALQLRSAIRARSRMTVRCPYCKHNLGLLSNTSSTAMVDAVEYQEPTLLEEGSEDAEEIDCEAVNIMAPGQVTGTCMRTPRVSTAVESSRAQRVSLESSASANEQGEAETDRLMQKSE